MGNKTLNARMVKYHIKNLEESKSKGEIQKITVTNIARRVGCTTNTLYTEFAKLIAPYMQSRKDKQKHGPNYGTLEYFKMQYEKKTVELEKEKEKNRKLRDQQMDYDILIQVVESLQEDKDTLISKSVANKGSKDLSERLMQENALLRGQLLKAGKKNSEAGDK